MEKDIRKRIDERVNLAFLSSGSSSDTTSIWQTVYGDMMTNLMLFFLMMFSLNMVGESHFKKSAKVFKDTIEGRKIEEKPVPQVSPPKNQGVSLKEFFKKFVDQEKDVQMIKLGEGVRFRLPEPVLFDLGRADLKTEAARILHEFAKGLKSLPNVIVVEGHTDDIPISRDPYKSNWELSEARAENVVNYLVNEEGIPAHRLAVAGFGEYWPFVPNDSTVNRALNRRIELLVIVNDKEK